MSFISLFLGFHANDVAIRSIKIVRIKNSHRWSSLQGNQVPHTNSASPKKTTTTRCSRCVRM